MNPQERVSLPPEAAGAEQGSSRLFQLLWRGKWLILLLPILFAGVTRAYVKGKGPFEGIRPVWRATARLTVGYREIDPLRGEGATTGTSPRSLLNQQRALMRSEQILRQIAEQPEVADMRHFREDGRPVMSALNRGLQATVSSSSDLLQIHFDSVYKREAEKVVNLAVEVYLEHHREKKRADVRDQIDLIQDEIDQLIERSSAVLEQIQRVKAQHVDLAPSRSDGGNLLEERLRDYDKLLNEAMVAEAKARSSFFSIKAAKEDPDQFFLVGQQYREQNPIPTKENKYSSYKALREEAERDLEQLKTRLNPDSSRLSDLRAQIEGYRQKEEEIILEYSEAKLIQARLAKEDTERVRIDLENDLDGLHRELMQLGDAETELARLEREGSIVETAIQEWTKRIGELELKEGTGALNIDVMEYARAGGEPVHPDADGMTTWAGAIGLALALALILLRGFTDHRILSVEEVPELFGVSVLAVLPRMSSRKKRSEIGRLVEREQGSLAAEAIRSVRTATTFALPENGKGTVLVTSSVAGEGKSVTASNLAIALAQAGRRTMLVDGDLRAPGQNEIYGVSGKVGLGDVLAGVATVSKAVIHDVVHGLDLLPAGDATGKAAELVESRGCRELIASLAERYDCVVIDSSPVLETAETRVLASLADLVIFVLRMDVSTTPDVVRSRDILRSVDASILGVVINSSRTKKGKAYAEGIAYGSYPRKESAPVEPSARVASLEVKKGDSGKLEAWS